MNNLFDRLLHHPKNPIVWISAGILAIVFLMFVRDNLINRPENWEQKAKNAIHVADSIRNVNETAIRVADSLHKVADQKTVEIKTLVKVADSLHVIASEHRRVITNRLSNLPDSCKAVVMDAISLADTYKMEVDTLRKAITDANARDSVRLVEIDTLRQSLKRATLSNADLTEEVRAALRREKLFGLVPMPSRTTSFLIGVATGATAIVYLKR